MSSSNSTMDAKLWGNLQHHINLEDVYRRLPAREFFQLRGVCKAWNSLAHQRRCFTEGIQKPYFVIVNPVHGGKWPYSAGILTLHIASGQWRWTPLRVNSNLLDPLFLPFSVNGLVFHSVGNSIHQVYDAHVKKLSLRFSYIPEQAGRSRVLAMAVDACAPSEFKLILGGLDTDTLIYSSLHRDWEVRPSRILAITGRRWPSCMKSCLQYNDRVYVWRQTDMILVYSLKEDTWTTLNPPENNGVGGALGCWDSRLFIVMEDERSSVSVWELVDESRQAWRHFARSPAEIAPRADDSIPLLANFCDQYVLIYTLLDRNSDKTGISDHFVLFDLATKQWEFTGLWDRTHTDTDGPGDTRRLRTDQRR